MAAASLAGIVAIVPVVGLLTTAGDDDAGQTIPAVALEEAAPETTAPEEARTAAPEAASADADGADDADASADAVDPAGAADEPESSETFAAEAPMEAQSPETTADEVTTSLAAGGERNGEGLPPLVAAPELAGYLAHGIQDGDLLLGDLTGVEIPCVAEAEEEVGPGALPLAPTVLLEEGGEAVAFVDAERTRMAVFSTADCAVVLSLP